MRPPELETNETTRCNKQQEAVGTRQKNPEPGLPDKNARAELKTNSPVVVASQPANQHANERAEFFGNSEVA